MTSKRRVVRCIVTTLLQMRLLYNSLRTKYISLMPIKEATTMSNSFRRGWLPKGLYWRVTRSHFLWNLVAGGIIQGGSIFFSLFVLPPAQKNNVTPSAHSVPH